MDDPIEDGLCSGGSSSITCHSFVQGLEVVTFFLAISTAFGQFFSEKCWLDDVDVGSVDGLDAARGGLAIWHDLACVNTLGATGSASTELVQCLCALLSPPGGGSAASVLCLGQGIQDAGKDQVRRQGLTE